MRGGFLTPVPLEQFNESRALASTFRKRGDEMLLHCYAVVPKSEERDRLAFMLRHHKVEYYETTSHIAVDIHCVSFRTVEKIVQLFDEIDSDTKGVTVIGNKEELPYDTS